MAWLLLLLLLCLTNTLWSNFYVDYIMWMCCRFAKCHLFEVLYKGERQRVNMCVSMTTLHCRMHAIHKIISIWNSSNKNEKLLFVDLFLHQLWWLAILCHFIFSKPNIYDKYDILHAHSHNNFTSNVFIFIFFLLLLYFVLSHNWMRIHRVAFHSFGFASEFALLTEVYRLSRP